MQRRFEDTLVGEALISCFIVVVVAINLVWNLPSSEIAHRAMPVLEPAAKLTGAAQSWSMYAPDPIRRLEDLDVRVTLSDGSTRMWTNTRDGYVLGPFLWYRWQKVKEIAVRRPEIRAGLAHWVVRELTDPSERPVRVEMVLRTRNLLPPSEGGPAEPKVETIYSETLAGRP